MTDPYLSWLRPDVAQGMHDLVTVELADESHPPYRYFLMAMTQLAPYLPYLPNNFKMIDAGCGVGHYGFLTRKHCPLAAYSGFDFSDQMVYQARNAYPLLSFFKADAKTFDYSPYDLVLASSLIEVMDQWDGGAEQICKTAPNLVLLHRVRVHGGPTVREDHEGYPGQPTYAWVHNRIELPDFFDERGFRPVWLKYWDEFVGGSFDMATYIFRRM